MFDASEDPATIAADDRGPGPARLRPGVNDASAGRLAPGLVPLMASCVDVRGCAANHGPRMVHSCRSGHSRWASLRAAKCHIEVCLQTRANSKERKTAGKRPTNMETFQHNENIDLSVITAPMCSAHPAVMEPGLELTIERATCNIGVPSGTTKEEITHSRRQQCAGTPASCAARRRCKWANLILRGGHSNKRSDASSRDCESHRRECDRAEISDTRAQADTIRPMAPRRQRQHSRQRH